MLTATLSLGPQGIEAWRQWVTLALETETLDPERRHWVLSFLLPWVYWTQQVEKTRKPDLKIYYQKAASTAFDRLFEQPMTQQTPNTSAGYAGAKNSVPNINAPRQPSKGTMATYHSYIMPDVAFLSNLFRC